MRIDRLAVLSCALLAASCSSDKSVGRTPLAIGAGYDGAAVGGGAPAAPAAAVSLTQDMAQPYWTTGV
ncbi:MAG TPA: hypothetical protein VML75_16715, partial [Kofleriaceae bacterium]|nr:hypothetical protein [Kofleriaceae bacterium]